jgi:hypothetical protein
MPKYISVADSYVIYELNDEAFELLSGGMLQQPPHVIMEVLVLHGAAKRLGSVNSSTDVDVTDEDEEPPEGEGPWVE